MLIEFNMHGKWHPLRTINKGAPAGSMSHNTPLGRFIILFGHTEPDLVAIFRLNRSEVDMLEESWPRRVIGIPGTAERGLVALLEAGESYEMDVRSDTGIHSRIRWTHR